MGTHAAPIKMLLLHLRRYTIGNVYVGKLTHCYFETTLQTTRRAAGRFRIVWEKTDRTQYPCRSRCRDIRERSICVYFICCFDPVLVDVINVYIIFLCGFCVHWRARARRFLPPGNTCNFVQSNGFNRAGNRLLPPPAPSSADVLCSCGWPRHNAHRTVLHFSVLALFTVSSCRDLRPPLVIPHCAATFANCQPSAGTSHCRTAWQRANICANL